MAPQISLFGREFTIEVKLFSALLAVLGFYALQRVVTVVRMLRAPSFFPVARTAFEPFALPGALFPTTSWTTGLDWHWVRRFQRTYARNETVNLIPILSGKLGLWTSNIDIARQIAAGSHRSSWVKPLTASGALLVWGMSLIASDGQMWRKHRRIVGPAFGTDLYKLVWKHTAQIYQDMVEGEGWNTKQVVDVPVIQSITHKLAFLVISTCGFGFPSTWSTPTQSREGEMPVQEALRVVGDDNMILVFTPEWLLRLPIPRFKTVRMARDRLMRFMQEQVAERKAEVAAGHTRPDVFTMLVKANQDESSKHRLDDDELIGNIFVFLFAGHETTAHTLAGTLGFLAAHDDIQQEVLEQIISVVGTDREPQFEDYPQLDKVLATFYETARMFPAAHVLIREATEDTVLNIPNPVGEEGSRPVPIPKGTQVVVDMVGAQYNPRYFEDPQTYKPSRWYGLPTDSELFTAFSVGPRACIGRRFATVEAVCFLANFLRDWKVLPILRGGETRKEWGARVLDGQVLLTLGVKEFPLRVERRKLA
ncbi:cytochrome P450 [Mycena galericulata]|nr:cytochrome P450 [Mycena galericulata]